MAAMTVTACPYPGFFPSRESKLPITVASWSWVRQSNIVAPIINAQPILQLDFERTEQTFFGHLLNGLDEEIAALPNGLPCCSFDMASHHFGVYSNASSLAGSTRQAYEHAVAVLN